MKKIILTLLLVVGAVFGGAAFSACGASSCNKNDNPPPEAHTHVYGDYTVTQPATCTEDGYETATCTLCDETDTRVIPATGHTWGTPNKVEPTCLEEGYTETKCSVCNTSQKSEIVNATGHKWNIPAATCTEGQVCEVCEETGEPARGHIYDEGQITTPVSCGEDGIKTYSCTVCHDHAADKKEVYAKATGHILGATEATETTERCKHTFTYTAECQSCHQNISVGEPAVEYIHSYTAKITTPATCTTPGVKTYTCSVCEDVKTESYTDENAHAWGTTPTKAGNITTYTCTHNATHTRTVVKSDSDSAKVPAADLKSAGELELSNAAISFDNSAKGVFDGKTNVDVKAGTLEGNDKAAALGELDPETAARVQGDVYNFTMEADNAPVTTFGGKVTIKIPYTLGAGEDPEEIVIWYINGDKLEPMKATYSVIDGKGYAVFETEHFSYYTVTRMTPKERCELYGHNYVTKQAEATCVTNGFYLEVCTRCKDKGRDEIIPAMGHVWTEETQDATCTVNGKITRSCENCDATLVSTIFATGHKWTLNEQSSKTATCSESGKSHYDCSECGESYEVVEAQKAHMWQVSVVAPTCTLEGYTHKQCANCGVTVNSDTVKALGHDMVDTVVAPTCTEKGYTAHECSRCGYKTNNTDEKAALGHNMVNGVCSRCGDGCNHDWKQTTVKQATCTEEGYTEYTCSKCKSVRREDVTKALGHDFGLNKCTRCDVPNPALGDYYYNLLSSLYVKGLAVKFTDFEMVEIQNIYVNGILDENQSGVIVSEKQIDVTEMFISIDGGELFGAGRANMHVQTQNYNGVETVLEEDDFVVTIILQDGKLYMSNEAKDAQLGCEYNVIDFNSMFGDGVDYDQIAASLEWMDGYGKNILGDLAGGHKDAINAVLGNVISLLFGEPEITESGYKFNLDFEQLKEVNADLSELTVAEIVDKYMGEGTFDSIKESIDNLLGYNVIAMYGAIIEEDIDYDELCDAINALMIDIMGAPEFDADAMLDQYFAEGGALDATVADLLAQFAQQYMPMPSDEGEQEGEQPTAGEQLIAMVDGYFEQAEQLVVYEMFGEQGEAIQSMVEDYIDKAGNMASVSFITDKQGNMSSVLLAFNAEDFTVSTYEYDNGNETRKSEVLLTLKGQVELAFNGTINVDFVKEGLEKIQRGVRIGKNIKATQTDTQQYGIRPWERRTNTLELTSDGSGNILSLTSYRDWGGYNLIGSGTEYVGGVRRMYVDYNKQIEVTTILVNGGSAQILVDSRIVCDGWQRFTINGKATKTMITRYMRMYVDEDGNMVSEIKLQADTSNEPTNESGYVSFWYKAETQELSTNDTPHEYTLDEDRSVPAEGCEGKGYRLYVCETCNEEYKSYYTNGHRNTYTKVELEEGSETCEDGIIVSHICRDCGKVLDTYHSDDHMTGVTYIDVKELGSKCGGYIIVMACACGKYSNVEWSGIECDMHEVEASNTILPDGTGEMTFKCAVSDCPFEYKIKAEWIADPFGSVCDYCLRYTYQFGTNTANPVEAFTYVTSTTRHKNPTSTNYDSTEPVLGTEGGLYTVTRKSGIVESCSACGYKSGHEETVVEYYTDSERTLLVKRHTEEKDYYSDSVIETEIDEEFDGTENRGILSYNRNREETYTYTQYSEKTVSSVEATFKDDKQHDDNVYFARPLTYHGKTEHYIDDVLRETGELDVTYDTYGEELRENVNIGTQFFGHTWHTDYLFSGRYYLGNYNYTDIMYEIDGDVSSTRTATVSCAFDPDPCHYALHISRQGDNYGDNFEFDKQDNVDHIAATENIVSAPTCTQDAVYTVSCEECGYNGADREFGDNNGHHYQYDSAKGCYVCSECGLENVKNVDGCYILEDLTTRDGYASEGFYVIGYNYNRNSYEFHELYDQLFRNHYHPYGFTVEVSLVTENGGNIIPHNIDCRIVGLSESDEHTLIYVDIAQVEAFAKAQEITEYGVMISLVFNDWSGLSCDITLDPADYVEKETPAPDESSKDSSESEKAVA